MNAMSSAAATALAKPPSRIVAVDFWRGLCLLMIFVDHVPDSPLGMITLRSWGFSDAAEIFVFLAGFSSVLSFSRYFVTGGFLCGVMRVVKRTWQLLCAHVLLVFAGAATFALANSFTDSKPVMEQLNFSPFFVETDTAILRLLNLSYMPDLTDILPIYILFIGAFPIMWLMLSVSPFLALGFSGGLWLWSNVTHFSMANYPEGLTWFFNPMAWQFMFVLGAFVSWNRDRVGAILDNKWIVWASALMVLAGIVAVAPWAQIHGLETYRLVSAELLTEHDKNNLALARILHFIALAVVARRLLPPQSAFWSSRFVHYVSLCGRHALPVYCTGVIAAMSIDIYLGTQKPPHIDISVAEISGLALLLVLGFVLNKGQSILRRADAAKAVRTAAAPAA